MAEKRKDAKGRNLRTGEYYDDKNQRYVFRKMVNGERVSITAADLADLRKQENELLCGIDRGLRFNTKKAKLTLNEYFDYWTKNFSKSGRKATTCTNYQSYYNTYIRNTIGKKQISKVIKLDCQKIINQMQAEGKSHSTMSNMKSCLNIVFESAMDEDVIFKNPVKNIQIPQTATRKRTAIDREQIAIFMDYVKNSRRYNWVYPEFVVLFNTGIRIGEMAALTWDNIDFENNMITIEKTINRYRKKDYGFTVAMASPKSRTSTRTFPMNMETRLVLLKLKMKSVCPAAAVPFVDDAGNIRKHVSNLVFINSAGNVWTEPTFAHLIKRIVARYNEEEAVDGKYLEDFCPHMARHTYTTLAYSAGADVKMVSEMLGHASSAVTLDTYTHITEEKRQQQEKIVEKIKVL